MSQKYLILTTIVLLAISFISLAYIESRAKNPNLNKNWWVLSFQDPHGSSLDFTIENHSNSNDFTYEIIQDNNVLDQTSIIIPKGESKNISVPVNQTFKATKTTITAWTNDKDRKEIHK
jgi:hypothetical protein